MLPSLSGGVTASEALQKAVEQTLSVSEVIDQLPNIDSGLLREFVLRSAFAKDLGWWNKSTSPFRITEISDDDDSLQDGVNYWTNRALRLCAYDITVSNLNMGFLELMSLDVYTFELVEEWVHKIAELQRKNLPDDMKKQQKQE